MPGQKHVKNQTLLQSYLCVRSCERVIVPLSQYTHVMDKDRAWASWLLPGRPTLMRWSCFLFLDQGS